MASNQLPGATVLASSGAASGLAFAPSALGPPTAGGAVAKEAAGSVGLRGAAKGLGEEPAHSAVEGHAGLALLAAGLAGCSALRGASRRSSATARPMAAKRRPTAVTRTGTARQAVATIARTEAEVGQKLHGWTCERIEELEELKCTGVLWRHDKTGAELISVEQPLEENKTFGVVFRTPPEDSNGIAHVLEHSVLCGSRKYPVKEPFTELLKGSMQTFLNAMTFPDRTCYPVASCNLQDFYNLVDVYLDAVLHPRALKDPRVLAQEGWHYEIEDKSEPLTFKGVVFNEMKGVYSNPDSVQSRTLLNNLLPDTPYGVDSGGDPKEIPNLTFEYFKGFHERFYHPSNAKFWFYGDDPPARRLELLDEFLRDFEKKEVTSEIAKQPLWVEPRAVEHAFAVGKDEDISKKSMACVSWVMSDDKPDLEMSIALGIMDYCLMGTPGAPLRKALTDSGLGSRVIGGGLYDGLVQPTFSVGLKDIKESDAKAVEELVMKTLTAVAADGFEPEAVEAALNKIEFENRELNTGGFPRGLSLMFAAVQNWNYGKDPFEGLRFEAPLRALREKLVEKKEPLLEDLLRKRILENTHRLVVTSKPDVEEGPRVEAAEKERLEQHRATLSEADIQGLIDATKELKELQETPDQPEALATVPRLELDDIPKESKKIPTELGRLGAAEVLKHPLLTSGVVYVDLAFNLRDVPSHLLTLVPLFCRGLREMGTKSSDFVQLQRRIDLSTGGISTAPLISAKRDSDEPMAYLMMRGKAMEAKVPSLMDLMAEIATGVTWENKDRFLQLARESQAAGRSQLLSAGHVVAAGRLGRQLTVAGWASEQISGLSQFEAVGQLIELAEKDWPKVESQLRELQACIFKSACVVNLTADADVLPRLDSHVETFLGHLPDGAATSPFWVPEYSTTSEGIVVPSQVNYVGKAANLYKEADYKLHGSAVVTSRLLGTTWLWDKVRVVGGAYGGFCNFDVRSGDFKYLSYRDPNLQQTLDAYDGTAEFLRSMEFNDDMLAKSIIGTMGDVDQHQLPDAKGYTALQRHLLGETDEMRQEMRDQILGTTADDMRSFADALEAVKSGSVCVVGGEDAIQGASESLGLKVTSPFAAS
mmetsp:Transcript_18406/g.46329  ORF Transcript_18406/g.46329 Transcript_18406/m.46329 type:complete len:1103 (+) Transcript_18406:46-3354(+)